MSLHRSLQDQPGLGTLLTTLLPGFHAHPCLGIKRLPQRYLIRANPERVCARTHVSHGVHVAIKGLLKATSRFLLSPKARTRVFGLAATFAPELSCLPRAILPALSHPASPSHPACPSALVLQDAYRRRQRVGHGRKDNGHPGAGRHSSSNSPSRKEASRRSQVTWQHLEAADDTAWPGAVETQ